jgi:hypothetical protein
MWDRALIGLAVESPTAMKPTLLIPCLLAAVLPLAAADPPKPKPEPPVYLTAAEGGRDYADQGEYLNDWGGAQVIALGDDAFRLVTYKGGLPGAGWDKESRREIEGKREGEAVRFATPDGYTAVLAGGTLTITTATGGPYTMKKTARTSPTLGAKAPDGAVVLFDGSSVEGWEGSRLTEDHWLTTGGKTKARFGSYSLHVEFLLPFKPLGRGQGRGNSGVYMQDRYEVQVLDSFGLTGEHNECGGIYNKAKPSVNMCLPPLVWQTYDIDFQAARFDASGNKTGNAVITVRHNGVVIHDRLEIDGPTGGGQAETPAPGPIQLQGHGNPVFYRNIWIKENAE